MFFAIRNSITSYLDCFGYFFKPGVIKYLVLLTLFCTALSIFLIVYAWQNTDKLLEPLFYAFPWFQSMSEYQWITSYIFKIMGILIALILYRYFIFIFLNPILSKISEQVEFYYRQKYIFKQRTFNTNFMASIFRAVRL
ncbi:MAG: hypothetical protein M3Q56_05405, partial [Bacteroidota bacterium]|nr:hypothetical protein [Bacteroidota bacterium]